MSEIDKSLHCSFCGKNATEVKKLIAGPDVYICDECIDLCHGILKGGPVQQGDTIEIAEETDASSTPTPRQIKEHLDQYVIGQEDAKKTISVAVYNHYRRLDHPVVDGVEIEKSNILMFGPTGSGKTLIAQSIARMLNVPLAIVDATGLTEAGYVGEDVESIVTRLVTAAGGDAKKAERGIIFIDEMDKKRGKGGEGTSGTRDVSGEGVQQGLLKLLEGTEIMVAPQGKGKDLIKLNTKNILFIVGGAFVGLDKIVSASQPGGQKNGIGMGAKTMTKAKPATAELLRKVQPEHLVKFGLIPELIGRLPVYAPLEELSEEQLVRVLTEPKNAVVKQFAARFGLDNVALEFTPEALNEVAKIARVRKTGARGLRSVIENSLMTMQFELPELSGQGITKVVVGLPAIKGEGPPTTEKGEQGGTE